MHQMKQFALMVYQMNNTNALKHTQILRTLHKLYQIAIFLIKFLSWHSFLFEAKIRRKKGRATDVSAKLLFSAFLLSKTTLQ